MLVVGWRLNDSYFEFIFTNKPKFPKLQYESSNLHSTVKMIQLVETWTNIYLDHLSVNLYPYNILNTAGHIEISTIWGKINEESIAVTTIFYMLCGCMGYAAFWRWCTWKSSNWCFGFYNPCWLIDIEQMQL
jgi:hypothetical protein